LKRERLAAVSAAWSIASLPLDRRIETPSTRPLEPIDTITTGCPSMPEANAFLG